jgi:SAM-dependent methyltransferase
MDDAPDDWAEVADVWSRYWAPVARPAQLAMLGGLPPGSSVLDVGCGSGEFLALLLERGMQAAGCDPSSGMVDLARARCPRADIRVAAWESLPWPDDAFDLVTATNTLQFADDPLAALTEAARVGRGVAIANWADDDRNDLTVLERALAGDDHEPSGPDREPGYLTALLTSAGFTVELESLVETPMELPDAAALVTALTFGDDDPDAAELVLDAALPFRRPDGGFLLRNAFRYAVARR